MSKPVKIISGLFIGDVDMMDSDMQMFKELHVTHVVNLDAVAPREEILGCVQLSLGGHSADVETLTDITEDLDAAREFISAALASGGNVLVRGVGEGSRRAVSIIVAFIMQAKQLSFERAWGFVSQKCPALCLHHDQTSLQTQIMSYFESKKEPCANYLNKGRCKFGDECRFSHAKTLTRRSALHAHALGPDEARKRKKNFCDECGNKSPMRWRCTENCDYDLCNSCLTKNTVTT